MSPEKKLLQTRIRITVALVAATAIVLLVGFFLVRLRAPVVIPPGVPEGELAFNANHEGNWEIYTLDADGSLRNLSNHPAGDYFPSWAFDSSRVNFLSARDGAELLPAQVRADGSGARTLSILEAVTTVFFEGRLDWDAHWSPQGDYLGWASVRDFNLEIYVQDLNGDEAQRLTRDSGRDWFPAWSPDGQRLAFASDRAGNEDLYVIDRTGENLMQLTDHLADDIRPFWSLDGRYIGFVTEREHELFDGVLDVFVMNVDGSEQRRLAEGEVFEGGAVWSPDGRQTALMSNREGRWQLYLLPEGCADPAAACVRRLTNGAGDALFPVWRP